MAAITDLGYKEQIDLAKLPRHIAIIMDGNGRWAKQHGKSRIFGHKNGVSSVRETVEACAELGVEYLTLYAFSTQNWSRPKMEVTALMELLVTAIRRETVELNKNDIRLTSIGDLSAFPKSCQKQLKEAIKLTEGNNRMCLNLALGYSSKWELTEAMKQIAKAVKQGKLDSSQIDETLISDYLSTRDIPDPELLIRTSGEKRISNFLLWQIAYTELYFTPTLWPDFGKESLYEAIVNYQHRERRFGMISEQVKLK